MSPREEGYEFSSTIVLPSGVTVTCFVVAPVGSGPDVLELSEVAQIGAVTAANAARRAVVVPF